MRRRAALLMGGGSIKTPSYYWKFDTSSVEVFTGKIMSANNASLISFSEGKINNAVFFTGNKSGYRSPNLTNFPKLNVWNSSGDLPFSFSVWLYKIASNGTTSIPSSSIRNTIIGVTGAGGHSTAWAIGIDSESDQVILYLNDKDNGTLTFKSTSPIMRNQWELVQILYDGMGGARIFINTLEEGDVVVTDTGYISMKNSNPYGVGISSHSQSNSSGFTFIGGIDDMAFWNNHLLTEKERSAIWNGGIGRRIRN